MQPVEAHWAEYFGVGGFTADAPPKAGEITLREPRLAIPASLEKICTTDHYERLAHTYGRSLADQIRAFRRDFTNALDVVAYLPRPRGSYASSRPHQWPGWQRAGVPSKSSLPGSLAVNDCGIHGGVDRGNLLLVPINGSRGAPDRLPLYPQ